MFRSSANLRLAADMRALARVAAPWREARTSWFDGTPESIEARLAATERVLTYARGGSTPAHMELEREAAHARAELTAAQHRLLTDFLDDGARAFKGSRRVANGGLVDDVYGPGTPVDEFGLPEGLGGGDGPSFGDMFDSAMKSGALIGASRRTADETTGFGDLGPGYEHFGDDDFAEYDDYLRRHDYHTDHRALEHRLRPGLDDDDPARYSSRDQAMNLRTSAIDFLASQNTDDRQELLFRAHRHASEQTGQLSVPVAQRVVQSFVAAVNREIAAAPRQRRAGATRTAAAVPDFPDELMF